VNTNVLLITPYTFNSHGGVQNQVNLMQEYLDEHKLFDVKVFAHGKDPSLENNKIFNIPFNSSISSVMLFPGKKLLHEYLDWADVVHVHEPFVPLIFWRLPKNKKYVFTHHAALNSFVQVILNLIYKMFKYKAVSTHVSNEARKNALTLSNKTTLIPNMIKINRDASYNNSEGYLFIGRNEKRKNLKFFNMLSMHKSFKDKKFIAITNELFDTSTIDLHLNPSDEEKNTLLLRTNIYLALNTKSESFGITLLEAVNHGNLVVSSDLVAFKDVLEDSFIVFKNNNFNSLVSVLSDLTTKDLKILWEKQYEDIKKYDLSKNMSEFISIYSKL
tara:strand:+ start:4868 stop:5857 length:990 start_codon:yes stop_codon:yes gene_type:complete